MSSIFSRAAQIEQLRDTSRSWDMLVIGGGASGTGVAVDAASRGYRVALVEQHDFGKGTSSRSTKLIHGGLRYLQQGRVRLVHHALVERGLLCRNAPHLVHPLTTIVPVYSWWESFYYGVGVKMYDRLSGSWSLGRSRTLSREEAVAAIPTLSTKGLYGAVSYLDGAFDDTRLLVNLMQTAIEQGATCANYVAVRELIKEAGRVRGVVVEDLESGATLRLYARVVVNATGPFADKMLQLDEPAHAPIIAPSQGIHLVFDREFLPSSAAIIVPKTPDGRVIFAVPWHEHTVIGTTDTPITSIPVEPKPLPGEVDFILDTIGPYLSRPPTRNDIRSIFAGIRPLVRSQDVQKTSKLGRDHEVRISESGLVSLLGGKWTTYRRMAEDCVDHAIRVGDLRPQPCRTKELAIHGHSDQKRAVPFETYGSDAAAVEQLIASNSGLNDKLAARLPFIAGQVVFAARHEMARTVEDVLARRTRALFLDATAALEAAPRAAALLAAELGRDAAWQADKLRDFQAIARNYQLQSDT